MSELTIEEGEIEEAVESLKRGRLALRWMAQGVMPAPEVADAVATVLRLSNQDDPATSVAGRTLAAIRQGIAPSQEICLRAEEELERLMRRLLSRRHDRSFQSPRG